MHDRNQIIEDFCLNYDWTPNDLELAHFTRFCDTIHDIQLLKKVLDPNNHPEYSSGIRPRPRVGKVLVGLRNRILSERYHKNQAETRATRAAQDRQAEIEAPTCFYCDGAGRVYDLVWLEEGARWGCEQVEGFCKHCADGLAEPGLDVLKLSRKLNIHCVQVIGRIMIALLRCKLANGKHVSRVDLQQAIRNWDGAAMPTQAKRLMPGEDEIPF